MSAQVCRYLPRCVHTFCAAAAEAVLLAPRPNMMFLLFVAAVFLPTARLQSPQEPSCLDGSCSPPLGDLMVGRASQLSASSTCGQRGPQNYCIIGYLEEEQKCFTCDSREPYDRYSNPNSHQIENIITTFEPERKMKWWQSENGVHDVSIRLDLETVFQFSHLVLTFKSFRPAAMLVERSKDFGQTWKVFRYFAEDCSLYYPSVSKQLAESIDDIVCDSRYSGSEPSTDGEVVLKALDPIFNIEDPYAPNVQDLILVTNIRVNFSRLFTLGDTLLGRKRRNPEDKYYYALYNMVVRGSCFCNGHASQCTPVDTGRGDVFTQAGMVHGRCICLHNTAGENCERCEDFHHDSPWRPGGANTADICRRCNCNGHSDSCHFDGALFEATGGVSGGVCDNCRNNRMGPQCERCLPFLYQDPQRRTDDPQACISCDCDPTGSQDGGMCDAFSGQCICKHNVEGQRCDRCKYGFFNLRPDNPDGCQECQCHVSGSIGSCDQQTGSCECDRLAVGPLCDRCLEGYWGLGNTLFGCSPCDCDLGGSEGSICTSEDGQCPCLPNMVGRRCSEPANGYFLPQLDYYLYEAELATPLYDGASPPAQPTAPSSSSSLFNTGISPQCEQYYRQQGYDFKLSNGQVVLVRRTRRRARQRRQGQQHSIPLVPGQALQIVPRQRTAGQPVTWTGLGLVRVLDGAGLRFTVDNLPSSMDYQLAIRYEPEALSDWIATVRLTPVSLGNGRCTSEPPDTQTLLLPGTSRAAVLETPVCLNEGGRYFVDIIFNNPPDSTSPHILIDSMGLIPRIESVQDFCSQTDIDSFRRFRCIGLAAELNPGESLPEVCEGLVKSMSARINSGAVACRCNPAGSVGLSCSKLGGICECKPNVIGRCCDTCAPLTFGFGTDGCQPCECDPRGAVSELCDQVRGQCACRSEVSGRRCNHCRTGYWGFPLCRPCECNGLSDVCDEVTGECLSCREHSAGANCDRCEEGYHGNPALGETCQPCLCPDVQGSGRFFATSCQHSPQSLILTCICQEGHMGERCDRCHPGFYGDLALPGAHCEPCPCNGNIDLADRHACNSLTGECLRCLHDTTGPQCQDCKPGYYGNALVQDCKECPCDRRGTEVTRCPLGSPCFCDPRTGQCPCRTGVVGVLCDECEDGYWNLNGASGCQPCSCDAANSVSYICDKLTGQCPCRAEFGGRQCDECGENHFGNPDLQCISCDCNINGTQRPSCDRETGECLCRTGVTGIFCDKCAPGHDSSFPACEECHPCNAIWAEDIEDVQRATEILRTLIPVQGLDQQPGANQQLQRILAMATLLEELANMTGHAPLRVSKLENLVGKIKKLKKAIDPNVVVVDPTAVLDPEIDHIQKEFQKLVHRLKKKLAGDPDAEDESPEELLEEIKVLNKSMNLNDERVRDAAKALEDSMDTRELVKFNMSSCRDEEDLAQMEMNVEDFNVSSLNMKVCGSPGQENCTGCGGALCVLTTGQRKCGGPTCNGVVPVSQRALESAEQAEDQLRPLPSRLEESINKIMNAKQAALETKDLAEDLQDRLNTTMDSFERDKNKTKELIQRVKDYLLDDMAPPEDIEKIARAVLDIQLPKSPDQISNMIDEINNLLSNVTNYQNNMKDLKEPARNAQELLEKAQELKNRTKDIDVTRIHKNIYEAEKAQDQANDDLEAASSSVDTVKDTVQNVSDKLDDIETKLMNRRPEDLQEQIRALRDKTEQNQKMAQEANELADDALKHINESDQDMGDMIRKFQLLRERNAGKENQNQATELLKRITGEATKMKKDVEDKLRRTEELQDKIQRLLKSKEEKEAEVSQLLKEADLLRQHIAKKAEEYLSCTS